MGFIRWIIGAAFTLAVLLFVASNTQSVEISLTPFTPALSLPLYMVGLAFLGTGFVFGGVMVWINEAKTRKARRVQRREIKALQKELKAENNNSAVKTPPSDFFPALPKQTKN